MGIQPLTFVFPGVSVSELMNTQGNPNHRKAKLKEILIALIESEKVDTLGDLHDLTGFDLRTISKITEMTNDEIIGIFVFKKGISWVAPSSIEAKMIALGEI